MWNIDMKTILTTLCLLIASMTASYADEGRYQTTNITNKGTRWLITDTQTGNFRYCRIWSQGIQCDPWFDIQNDNRVELTHEE